MVKNVHSYADIMYTTADSYIFTKKENNKLSQICNNLKIKSCIIYLYCSLVNKFISPKSLREQLFMSFLTIITKFPSLYLWYLNSEIVTYLYSFPKQEMPNIKLY